MDTMRKLIRWLERRYVAKMESPKVREVGAIGAELGMGFIVARGLWRSWCRFPLTRKA